MKPVIFLLLFVIPFGLFSQEEVFSNSEKPAEFPGGKAAMDKYLSTSLIYPAEALEQGLQGNCYLRLGITADGKIHTVTIMFNVRECPQCDKEAVRLVKAMPDWKPATKKGKPVPSEFILPVPFEIPTELNKQ